MLSGANNFVVNDSTFVQNIVQNTSTGDETIPIRDILIEWLTEDNVQKNQRTLYSMCTDGTGKWFIGHPQFIHWMEHSGEVLWCPGFPGVGKTCIMSIAVHHLQSSNWAEESPILFYYFDYKNELTMLENVFETLLSQLIGHHLQENTKRKLTNLRARRNRPTVEDLIPILEQEIKTYQRCFILIDALDEFASDNIRSKLVTYIRKLVEKLSVNVMIFSRDNIPEILEDMQWAAKKRLDIVDHNEDIRLFIEKEIESNKKLKWLLQDVSTQEEVVQTVLSTSKGMFLTARLHMDAINNCTKKAEILQTLKMLPPKLNDVYDTALQRIKEHDIELALRLFSWILHSRRPLTLLELRHVLSIQSLEGRENILDDDLFPEQYIQSICVGLITFQGVSGGSPIVGFVHYTAHHYFKSCERLTPLYELVRDCLNYLCMPSIIETQDWSSDSNQIISGYYSEFPVLQYTSLHWGDHTELLPGSEIDKVIQLILKLLLDSRRMKIIAVSNGLQTDFMFFMLVLHGWTGLLNIVLSLKQSVTLHGKIIMETTNLVDVNATDDLNATALHYACAMGNLKVAELLLAQDGINPNIKEQQTGMTPLHLAVSFGTRNIDIFRWNHPDPLYFEERHIDIVKLLMLRPDVDPNICNNDGQTVLHLAIESHSEVILMILLQRTDVLMNVQDNGKKVPLLLATINTPALLEKICTRTDTDVNFIDEFGYTALYYSIISGNVAACKVLLQRPDLNIDRINTDGDSALHLATTENDINIVHAVLSFQRSKQILDLQDKIGLTALMIAVRSKNVEIVKLVLSYHPKLGLVDKNGDSALHFAVTSQMTAVMDDLLTTNECNIHQKNHTGNSPLDLILEKCYDGLVVSMLISKGIIGTDTKYRCGHHILFYAMNKRDTANAKTLLNLSGNIIDLRNEYGQTLLHVAALTGLTQIVSRLVDLAEKSSLVHAYVMSEDRAGLLAIHYASQAGHASIVTMLLTFMDMGNFAKHQEFIGSPLYLAYHNRQMNVVKLLLPFYVFESIHSANPETDDAKVLSLDNENTGSAISQEMKGGLQDGLEVMTAIKTATPTTSSDSLMNMIIKYPAWVLMKQVDGDGDTVIHQAIKNKFESVFDVLVNMDIDLNIANKYGHTPLHVATKISHDYFVKTLIQRPDVQPGIVNKMGQSVLHINAKNGEVKKILNHILARKEELDVNLQDNDNNTPLHIAAEQGHLQFAEALCSAYDTNINPNMFNAYGLAPLHMAIIAEHTSFVKFLISLSSVDIKLRGQSEIGGLTPCEWAINAGKDEITMLLTNRLQAEEGIINSDLDGKDSLSATMVIRSMATSSQD